MAAVIYMVCVLVFSRRVGLCMFFIALFNQVMTAMIFVVLVIHWMACSMSCKPGEKNLHSNTWSRLAAPGIAGALGADILFYLLIFFAG